MVYMYMQFVSSMYTLYNCYICMTAGALLTGNYGMWNAYTIVMMVLYAPSPSKSKLTGKLLSLVQSLQTWPEVDQSLLCIGHQVAVCLAVGYNKQQVVTRSKVKRRRMQLLCKNSSPKNPKNEHIPYITRRTLQEITHQSCHIIMQLCSQRASQ